MSCQIEPTAMLTEEQQQALLVRGVPPLKQAVSVTQLPSPLFCNLLFDILLLGVLGSGPIPGASVLVTYPDGVSQKGFLTDSHGNASITLNGSGAYIILVTPPDHNHCSVTITLAVLGSSYAIVSLPNQLANPPTGTNFQIAKPGVVLESLESNCFQGNSSYGLLNGSVSEGYPSGVGVEGATQPIQGGSNMGTFNGNTSNTGVST